MINKILSFFDFQILNNQFVMYIDLFISFLCLTILGVTSFYFSKLFLARWAKRIVEQSKTKTDDLIFTPSLFNKLSLVTPAIIIYLTLNYFISHSFIAKDFILNIILCYIIFLFIILIDSILSSVVNIAMLYPSAKRLPIRSSIQVFKLFTYFVGIIFILSTLLNKNPWTFLSGIGAMTAILLLIFKDSILGFVASIQLSTSDLVKPGDWIEMPQFGANGDVIEVSLNTVKVQNWDKTISSIPTYALTTHSFKNWRGMAESGGRRIKRNLNIDMNGISFCTKPMLVKLKNIPLLKSTIDDLLNKIVENQLEEPITNLGLFREYIKQYLRTHPKVNKNMTFLVRSLEPSSNGLPIQIYIFCNDQVWSNYENIQSLIFDHLLAIIPQFNLSIFQSPSGKDIHQIKS